MENSLLALSNVYALPVIGKAWATDKITETILVGCGAVTSVLFHLSQTTHYLPAVSVLVPCQDFFMFVNFVNTFASAIWFSSHYKKAYTLDLKTSNYLLLGVTLGGLAEGLSLMERAQLSRINHKRLYVLLRSLGRIFGYLANYYAMEYTKEQKID